ncbi:MAG: hypothetical protein COA79_25440 [Planctomycetota bacterium]|nr:MAG: hypothetical protein COA79_25440 [Planctomycetota bacterium]
MAKTEHGAFGKLAIEAGYITDDGLQEAIGLQNKQVKDTGERVNLGKILLDKGFMTKSQIKDILSSQAKAIEVPGYDIESKLGAGNMGAVYKAKHLKSGQMVALKIMSNKNMNDRFLARFKKEFEVLQKLKHPNIVQPVELGESGSIHYYAMEYIEGKTLREIQKEHKTLPLSLCLEIVKAVANALKYAHSHNVFHRDIKPDNLLVLDFDIEAGSIGKMKIIDFGLAKDTDVDSNLTMEGTGMGTPLYMAPEQVKDAKNVDYRADIYSLGATLFKMLTGKNAAFGKSSMEIVANVVKGKINNIRDYDLGLPEKAIVLTEKMMALDLKKRYSTYDQILTDIQALHKSILKKDKKDEKTAETVTKPNSIVENTLVESNKSHAVVGESSFELAQVKKGLLGTLMSLIPKKFLGFFEPVSYIAIVVLLLLVIAIKQI